MTYGHWGKALRVNLTTGSITTEELDEAFLRRYVGGWGFIAYYLLKELAPGIDPLGPENKLIFTTGPVTGQPIAGGGRNMVGAKSPLTGGFAASEAGGYFGAELKRTGWDTVIIEGVAESPVYLWIKDDQVELLPADHLWGLETYEVQQRIREERGDRLIRVAQCGPAGEKLVRISNIIHDANRAAGRTGLGAVMGAKKLRAVAVRGSKRPTAADPDKLRCLARWFRDHYQETGSGIFSTLGTMRMVRNNQAVGGLPTRNFQEGVFSGFEGISAETQTDTITVGRDTCFGCPIRCKWIVEVDDEDYHVDREYGGPEYETACAMGALCGIDDIRVVALANQLCNATGLDTIGTGVTIAFAMECYERGIIGPEDTDGLELRFGNGAALIEMIKRIVERKGFGDVLAEGSRGAAERIGGGAINYAIQIKGQEVAMHDPRVKYGHGLGIAVSPTGSDHMHSVHDSGYQTQGGIAQLEPFGILEPLPFDDLSTEKVRMVRYAMMWRVLDNLLGTCMFQAWTPQQETEMVAAITGWNTSVMELWLAAERAYDMARAFNAREGFGPEDDLLPRRFTQHFRKGPAAGQAPTAEGFRAALLKFYGMMGWDPQTAAPTRAKLEDLGIGWVADLVEERRT
ncbi:MAG TPA: aldehyde ferredoxin oxidoreductase family protein [Anaerolineae bacterium]|nr:aldehyde ferredoxin oxidoreductase family protein [Anaerolineae bacterium]